MTEQKSILGNFGLVAGSVALLLALTHFWVKPLAPQPTIESAVAEKITSIRTAALDALKGKEPEQKRIAKQWNIDDVLTAVTAALGGLAVILGVIGIARSEPKRVTRGAIILGVCAITFQFFAWFAVILLGVILIIGILAALDLDFSW